MSTQPVQTDALPVKRDDLAALGIAYTPAGAAIVHPESGELLHVRDADTAALAAVIDGLKEHQGHVRDGRALLEAEIIGRLEEAKERGARAGGFMVERKERRQWDESATWEALGALVDAGVISGKDATEAMPEVSPPPRKPDGRKLNALLTQLLGEVVDDPEKFVLVGALARARSAQPYLQVERCAIDGTAEDA